MNRPGASHGQHDGMQVGGTLVNSCAIKHCPVGLV